MEFCAPGQKKIESCVDDKLDFVFEGGCAKGFHTVPSRTRSPRSPSLSSVSRLASPSPASASTAPFSPPQAYITPDAYDVTVDDQHGGFSTGKPIEVTGIPGHYLNKFFVDEIDVGKSHAEISCERTTSRRSPPSRRTTGFAKELSCANQGFTVTSKYTCEECAPGFEPNKDESCQHGACLSGCHPVAPYTAPTTPP